MEIFLGILMFIITVLIWRVTVLQHKLDKKESRYKDFDRNFAAYQKIEKYIQKIVGGRLNLKDYTEFDEDTKDFQYVFGNEINNYVQKVKSFGRDLALLNDSISLLTNTELSQQEFDERKKYMAEKSELIKTAFIQLPSELKEIFEPFLLVNK